MYADEGNLEQILWNICLKCFFLRILHQILKLNLCTFAHRNCEYILGVIYLLCFPRLALG